MTIMPKLNFVKYKFLLWLELFYNTRTTTDQPLYILLQCQSRQVPNLLRQKAIFPRFEDINTATELDGRCRSGFIFVDYPEPIIALADDGQRHNNFSLHNDVLQSDALQLWEGTLPATDPAITAMLPDDAVWLNMHPVSTESQSATQLLQRATMVQPLEPVLAFNPAVAGVSTPDKSTAFQHDQQKRARGRPKKTQTNSGPVAISAPAPKYRGRQRKTHMTTDIDARGEKRKKNPQAVLATSTTRTKRPSWLVHYEE
ncbi:hypothetical protein DAPPUDRAFT_114194 [Daphnia pulex]|uniref:Uncharacterized protein n=1 Tax=Daphnia pulex TaxID=6669 RepID=E9HHC1_DAPPU|nr:hypothetical protein DAPPUDRAFT_114194 [Daphnia pulex]|eukprot:EFX68870.1 hypothetical protein DAPPUDRAFT_114194 [Daphnia pulex]